MRPGLIDESDVWPGGVRRVIGPPDDDPTGPIRPVEVVVDSVEGPAWYPEVPRFNVRVQLEEGDLERLRQQGCFWLSLLGTQLQPFQVSHLPAGVCSNEPGA